MFNHVSIATKLWLMSLFTSLFLIGSAALGYFALDSLSQAAWKMGQGKDVVADILPPPLFLVESQLVSKMLLEENSVDNQELLTRLAALKNDYVKRNTYWENNQDITSIVKDNLLGEQRKYANSWWTELENVFLPAISRGDKNQAAMSMKNLDNYYQLHRNSVDKTVTISSEFANDTFNNLGHVGSRTAIILVLVAIAGFLVSLILAYIVIRNIRLSLLEAGIIAERIAAGDLTAVIPTWGQDEVGQLLTKVVQMRDSLHSLISEMRSGVHQLHRSSSQLRDAATNGELVAQNQAESACSMAATIEQLSVSLDLVNENAGDARRTAMESQRRAQESSKVIEATANEMQKISDVVLNAAQNIRNLDAISSEITNILNVIHDVADQTNLLALNAAIEAARAGSYGRGFAVVADEVRTLAERTSSSSGEIKLMVGKIRDASKAAVIAMETGVKSVESGVNLSVSAGQSVKEIHEAQSQVAQSVDGIGDALREQAAATRDIAVRVEMVSQGAESLATTVSQTLNSAEELAFQAESLDKLASKFRL
ncbi:MAG: hypothetical protein RL563_1200 [Pseudomonadota bacterium]